MNIQKNILYTYNSENSKKRIHKLDFDTHNKEIATTALFSPFPRTHSLRQRDWSQTNKQIKSDTSSKHTHRAQYNEFDRICACVEGINLLGKANAFFNTPCHCVCMRF